MEDIVMQPIGKVVSGVKNQKQMTLGGCRSTLKIFSQYKDALLRIGENSHIWVIAWFHEANRSVLKTAPCKVNPDLPEYGVFALRAFKRPNPIGLCLVKLVKVDDNILEVEGLDAIDETPILDIKPYFAGDTIFSPRTSYIRPKTQDALEMLYYRMALAHHQEECPYLWLAVRMAVIAEGVFGDLHSEDIKIQVKGSRCLADCIQGITKARLANPVRLDFEDSGFEFKTTWSNGDRDLEITLRHNKHIHKEVQTMSDNELFFICLRDK